MSSLGGKVAIVTGGGRGLGRAMAATLAGAGAAVTVSGRTTAEIGAFAQEQRDLGRSALAVRTDIADEESVQAMVEATLTEFGRVDILVNNAGVISSVPFLEQDPADWDRIVATNLRGVYLATRAVGTHLVAQRAGKVINIASNTGVMGVPYQVAYSASKAAVIGLTRSLGLEWARYGVQVNALAPGFFETDMTTEVRDDEQLNDRILRRIPARRMGRPEELGAWLLLLAGPASDFMTGECIVIDGGQAAGRRAKGE